MPFGGTLYYLSPTGGFDFIISVCLVFGFLLSIPVVFYEFMRFVLPAFPKLPKVSIIFFSILSFILMAVGVGFAYFISLPAAFNFLEKFGNTSLKSLISADLFLSFVIHYVFGFGILFELPLVILIINKIYRLSIRNLLGFERWVILLSSIFAAILTPTSDIVNMAIMAVPIIVLYQLSILLVAVVNTKNHVS
jgi:sec-independent protein translocase protein TatC